MSITIRIVSFGGKVGGGCVNSDKRWGREWARMWMKRVMQPFSFVSSSSSVVSSLVVVVDDLRLLINKSLSLGVGIGEPVSICCQNVYTADMNGCNGPIHITFSSSPAVKTLAAMFNLSMTNQLLFLLHRETQKKRGRTKKQSCQHQGVHRFP